MCYTVNRLFLSCEKLTLNGIFWLISASKLPWTQKTNILRLRSNKAYISTTNKN